MVSEPEESYAAVDLGSNSFHMIVAKIVDGRLQIVDRIKEMVRLASGLNNKNELSEESMERALNCLQQFGQRIQGVPEINIRAVGTNTLRQAKNGSAFLFRAHQALGHPIEIISGREEARLIYHGVAHTLYDENNKRLVIDIGGGSTELIIGRGFETFVTESLYMGCVNIAQRFFSDGKIKSKKMQKAILVVRQEMEVIETPYKKKGWDLALGSSGTINTIRNVVQAQGWCDVGITAEALGKLKDLLIEIGDVQSIDLKGLSEHRRPVFASGVAVLCGLFEGLSLEKIGVSDGALREGLLHDLIGRIQDRDIRDQTIQDVAKRYGVDLDQAQRVQGTAEMLFHKVAPYWVLGSKVHLKLLQWSALIHEIGLSIAHDRYHRHGAYLILNSDLAGFSRQEQQNLAILVRAHRRKFPKNEFESISEAMQDSILRLSILLRIAIILHRSRTDSSLPDIQINVEQNNVNLIFEEDWLSRHPLTQADLESEKNYLQVAGVELAFA